MIFERSRRLALKSTLRRFALNLDNAVCYLAGRRVPYFNVAVDSGIDLGCMPDKAHLEHDPLDEVDSLLTDDFRVRNLLRHILIIRNILGPDCLTAR